MCGSLVLLTMFESSTNKTMKLLAVDLSYPDNTRYLEIESAGIFMVGRLISRHPLFAVSEDKTMTQIKLTSGDITIIQEEVNRQFEVLELREQIKALEAKLRTADSKTNITAD